MGKTCLFKICTALTIDVGYAVSYKALRFNFKLFYIKNST